MGTMLMTTCAGQGRSRATQHRLESGRGEVIVVAMAVVSVPPQVPFAQMSLTLSRFPRGLFLWVNVSVCWIHDRHDSYFYPLHIRRPRSLS